MFTRCCYRPMAYFCAGVTEEVTEMYGPRGPRSFSNAWHTIALVTSMKEDGTTLLKSPLGSGRPFGFLHHHCLHDAVLVKSEL